MKCTTLQTSLSAKRVFLLTLLVFTGLLGHAQAPTSLTYPTPNVYIANVNNIFLSPNVSGNVTKYKINPTTLPAGVALDSNTGVISGIPTSALPTTTYTATATGPGGSTTTTFTLQVTNNFFNNAYNAVSFSTSTAIRGNGTQVGDTILYTGVSNLSGQTIDALVITQAATNLDSFVAYDQSAVSGGGYSGNSPAYFSPQIAFLGAGSVTFNFQFLLGGSFNTTTKKGQSVTLQNVKLNTYDIDGNGTANSNQYAEFGGFDTTELGSSTILATSFDALANLTKFRSIISANSAPLTADSTRIRLTSNNISNFTITLGAEAGGSAYYVIDFSAGPAFATAVKTVAPSLDLNTTLPGVNNVSSSCGGLIPLSGGTGQTNIIMPAGSTLNELELVFDNTTANIRNGAGERIVVNGGTPASSDTVLLNFAAGTSPTVTLSSVTYAVTRKVSGTTSILSFAVNGGGTFSLAAAEALLDALRYGNTAANPTMGDRNFTVNVRNASYKSPDAVASPSVTCVSIGGNIFVDANGLTDTTVNANTNGTLTQLGANVAYAVLVNPATNVILAVQGISAGGAYTFGKQSPGTYNIILRSTAPVVGNTLTAASYPSGTTGVYRSIGENLGSGAGNDLQVDGIMRITVGSANITNANFGIELAPVTADTTFSAVTNPGGYNSYTLSNGGFNTKDEDGIIKSITITGYPIGANYLKIGNTYYTSTGSTCPPQITTCTPWAGPVVVPFSGGVSTQSISIDPIATGAVSIAIPFTAVDDAGVISNGGVPSNVNVSFVATGIAISGSVWNDSDGNGLRNGAEALTNAGVSGQTLYAYLVQTNTAKTYSTQPTIYASTTVSATGSYSFADVASGNDYEVRIVSAGAAPLAGALATSVTPALATNYLGVSTNKNGTITTGLATNNPFIAFANVTVSQVNNDLGIERRPVGSDFTAAKQVNPGVGVQVVVPAGAFAATDGEDAASGYANNLTNRKVTLNPATNGNLYYNGTLITTAQTYTSFDPTKVTIAPLATGTVTPSFTFSVYDNGGLTSLANTVNVPLDATAVALSGIVWDDNNGTATQDGTEPVTAAGGALYALLTDANGNVIQSALVNGSGAYSFSRSAASQPYKVVLSTTNAAVGTKVTTSSLPAGWVNTGSNQGGVANTGIQTGIINVTTAASGSTTAQNFGIEQTTTAPSRTFTISGYTGGPVTRVSMASTASGGGTYNNQIAMSGTTTSGNTPSTLTGTDADGGANGSSLTLGSLSGTAIKLSISPASYTAVDNNGNPVPNGIMILYNGVQLQPGGCQGGNSGTICSYYNSTTSSWEIPNYDATKMSILTKDGVKTQGFQYSWIDAAGKKGTAAAYSITASAVPLPVDLLSFTAKANGTAVLLNWSVANEASLSGYVVERSADAVAFTEISKVNAHNKGTEDAYQQTDAAPMNGANYYRLRIQGNDGNFKYSSVQSVNITTVVSHSVMVYPNPMTAAGMINITVNPAPASGTVRIMDQTGRMLVQQSLDHTATTQLAPGTLAAGIYLIEVTTDGQTQLSKLVVQ